MKRFAMVLAAAIFSAMAGTASADDQALKKEMHEYTLSMDKIRAMQGMKDEFAQLVKTDPTFSTQVKQQMFVAGAQPDMEARMSATPRLVALYRKHGLTVHDVVIMPTVLFVVALASQLPSVPASIATEISPAQIAFYKAHQAELKNIRWLNGG
jgi:hypothetical protein